MELKLVVLAGAKQGLEIPLKKDKFLIGRAKECSLRAGSEAISRRHCAIVRKDGRWTARDLGSRNGTYVNDVRIAEEVALNVGDELRVGPLHFRVALASVSKTAAPVEKAPAADPTKSRKQPPVKDVADVIQRTVSKAEGSMSEDDISRWLLGLSESNGEASIKETLTMQLEETTAHGAIPAMIQPPIDDTSETAAEPPDAASAADAPEESGKSGSWSLFKRSGGGKAPAPKKAVPGKLPPRPEQQSKDSREAAADILREMTRRR
jgi:pSer/pThr/pTyr-binding forkhead associated (FHA) protein